MSAKQASTGPTAGRRDGMPGGLQVCDHSGESGDSRAGLKVFRGNRFSGAKTLNQRGKE